VVAVRRGAAGLALSALLLPAAARAAARPEGRAARAEAAPLFDGEVLGDPAWAAAERLQGFVQTNPHDGEPVSEETEVRLLWSDDTLYIGVVCHDREPDKIIVSDSRRDSPLEDTDSFQVLLDTFRDGQSGFVFGTNPTGLEYDGQVVNEGQGSGPSGPGTGASQSGALGGFNLNWDGVWEVKAAIGDFGWSAEFAIPFRTLRYPGGGDQEWGVNFQRNIRRRNERAFWSPLPRQYTLFRVSEAGRLRGLRAPRQKNLQLSPYVLGDAQQLAARGLDTEYDGEVGADLKWGLSPSLTVDATVNTDFAQVEVDDQQINLDRVNIFFPEKRPFFLENAGYFTVGAPGEVELFFSRRIGIGREGQVVPILGGARLSGKVGGWNVGVLDMQTRTVEGVAGANNFAAARAFRELPNRSGVGAVFVNRSATGEGAALAGSNQTYALDGRWGFGRYGLVSGFVAGTSSATPRRAERAYRASASYESPTWILEAKYTDVGEGFNPEVGFLLKSGGYRRPEAMVYRALRNPGFFGLFEIRPHVSYRAYFRPDGFYETGFLHIDNHFEWAKGYELHTAMNVTHEGVRVPFEIYPGVVVPPGQYDHKEGYFVTTTDQGAPLSLNGTWVFGGFYGGRRTSLRPQVRGRLGDRFNADVRWDWNDVDLPQGSFETNLLRARVSYNFTTRLYAQAFVQWNDLSRDWSTNLRVGWLQSASTGLFVVYNEVRDTEDGLPGVRDRSFTVKWSRIFDLLD
jgi:hypothetical protein